MTEKVFLADIKRTQYSCFPLRLYGKKSKSKKANIESLFLPANAA